MRSVIVKANITYEDTVSEKCVGLRCACTNLQYDAWSRFYTKILGRSASGERRGHEGTVMSAREKKLGCHR